MIADVLKILDKAGEGIVKSIKEHIPNATGKTARSIEYIAEARGEKYKLIVLGREYLMALETGRKPKGDKPSPSMVKNIQEWMDAKGMEGSAYGIARYINKHGSKLYREGGRRDVITNVVNESLIDRISKDVLDALAQHTLNQIVEEK